jgi:molybdenum cofactor sulfurtransferase
VVISNSLIPRLAKPYFGGGTLVYALPEQNVEKLRLRPAERFEDGSLPFLNLAAVESGFRLRRQLGEANISDHVRAMAKTVVSRMTALNNTDGSAAVMTYQGEPQAIVGFNFVYPNGTVRPHEPFLASALANNITISGGCQGIPGACERVKGGALRVSVGWATTIEDIDRLIRWMRLAIDSS